MTVRKSNKVNVIPEEMIEKKIFFVRGKKVMLDSDLAQLYGVETRYLTRQVRRNLERFPDDFLLFLAREEVMNLKCHFGTSSWGGKRKLPLAFTEQGVAMLSSVLNSKRAIQVNIQIMRTFTKIREIMATHDGLRRKIESMEKKYDYQFKVVFDAIKRLLEPPKVKKEPLGFHGRK